MYGRYQNNMVRSFFLISAVLLLSLRTLAHDGAHENDIELEGYLAEVVESDAKKGTVRSYHTFEDSRTGEVYELKARKPITKSDIFKSKKIKIKGHKTKKGRTKIISEADIAYAYAGSDLESNVLPAELTMGGKRVLVLMLRTSDAPSAEPWPVADSREQVFTRVNHFFQEASFGKTMLSGDILGWETTAALSTECNFSAYSVTGNKMIADAGLDRNNYDILLYFLSGSKCGWAGMASTSSTSASSYINGKMPDDVVAHELGHNYGLPHASAYFGCTSGVGYNEPSGSCSRGEYGDHLDTMGNALNIPSHFNSVYKEQLGWLTTAELPLVDRSQNLTVAPYSSPLDGRIKAFKVPRYTDVNTGETTYFYFEYRQAIGNDKEVVERNPTYNNAGKGLTVHIASSTSITSRLQSYLIDTSPGSVAVGTYSAYYDLYNGAIEPGQTFSYPYSGMNVTVNSADGNGAMATVSYSVPQLDKVVPVVTKILLDGVELVDGQSVVDKQSIKIEATDNVSVSRVFKIYINGQEFKSNPGSTYLTIDFGTFPVGNIEIGAKALDVFGNESLIKVISVNNLGANLYPTGQIISPTANSTVSGAVIIKANAQDDFGVKYVNFYIDGYYVQQVATPPYEMQWDSTQATKGPHSLKVYVVDVYGKGRFSDTVYINVDNDGGIDSVAPSVSFVSPSNNSTVSGVIAISASASDNVAVKQVNFYVDGNAHSADASSPYGMSLDTRTLSNGTHTISAVAVDSSGNTSSAVYLGLNIQNQALDTAPPTVVITSPQNGASIVGTVAISVSASDNVAVAYVDVFIDGQLLCRDSTAPYSCSYSVPKGKSRSLSIVARAVDTSNNSQEHQILVMTGGGGKGGGKR